MRGCYPIFPSNNDHLKHGAVRGGEGDLESAVSELGPHLDGQVNQLNVMCYLSDVPERCGGTTVRVDFATATPSLQRTMHFPLIGQNGPIFIGNSGLFWICFDRIIGNA